MRKQNIYLNETQINHLVKDAKKGWSTVRLAVKYKVTGPTVLRYLHKYAPAVILPHVIKARGKEEEILELRAKKQTYKQIGDRYGITRERVRQIIKANAPSMIGHKFLVRDWGDKTNCAKCGVELAKHRKKEKFCPSCGKEILKRAHMANFIMREHLRVAMINDMRNSGKTWIEIGAIVWPNKKGSKGRAHALINKFKEYERILRHAKWE